MKLLQGIVRRYEDTCVKDASVCIAPNGVYFMTYSTKIP